MLALYRRLLYLYPSGHRYEYGEEMVAVFREAQAEARQKRPLGRAAFCVREVGGLLCDALQERLRSAAGFHRWSLFRSSLFPSRRFAMRSEFRFPKATTVLMVIILAGVVLAIEKAKAINASLPAINPQLGPIEPAHFTFFPTIALVFAFFYAAGVLGWAVLFALRRSGVHRLSEMQSAPTPK
jgi:hypothetical protein